MKDCIGGYSSLQTKWYLGGRLGFNKAMGQSQGVYSCYYAKLY
jgi:hypothetical protein